MNERRYRIVLPAGWSLLPVREGTESAIEATVDTLLTTVPHDSRAAKAHFLRSALTDLADEARAAGGLDLVIPLAQPWALPTSVSIVMSIVAVGRGVRNVEQFAARNDASAVTAVVETNGGPALREQRDAAVPTAERADQVRAVTYTWIAPGGVALMGTASITSTTYEGYEQIVDAMTDLVDTVLSSVSFDAEARQGPAEPQAAEAAAP